MAVNNNLKYIISGLPVGSQTPVDPNRSGTIPTALSGNTATLAGTSINTSTIQNNNPTQAELQKQIQSLEKSTATQEARITTVAGPEVMEQYEQEQQEQQEGLISKFFNLLDTPRNTLFVGFRSAVRDGDFFGGLYRGFTREEVYSGYDLAEDLGFSGAAQTVVGFAAEVVLDPTNYFSAGLSSLVKGFIKGAVTDAVQEVGEQYVKSSVREMASEAAEEGIEKGANAIIDSGIKGAENIATRTAAERAAMTANTVANSADAIGGAKGVVSNVNKTLDAVENTHGIVYGSAKKQALFYQAKQKISEIGNLIKGDGIANDTLKLAKNGNFGDELKEMALSYESKRALLASTTLDDAGRKILQEEVKTLKSDLVKGLREHIVDVRIDAFKLSNIDGEAVARSAGGIYEDTISGALYQMKKEFQVADADGLKQILTEQLGREATDSDLLYELIQRGFGESVTGQITKEMSTKAMRDVAVSTLMDYTGSMNYYRELIREYGKQVGRSMRWEIPFTNINKEIASAEQLYTLGAKARTAISYRVTTTRCC